MFWLLALCLMLLLSSPVQADMLCNGTTGDSTTNLSLGTFCTSSTCSMTLWYKPTGSAQVFVGGSCNGGAPLFADLQDDASEGTVFGLFRNLDYVTAGEDSLCGTNDDGTVDGIPSDYSPNVWTHLALVHSGGNLVLYKDGTQVGSVASGNSRSTSFELRLCGGTVAAWTAHAQGQLALARIYNTALSASEIELQAKGRIYQSTPTLGTGMWTFDTCGDGAICSSAFPDRSGNGRTLTNSNITGAGSSYLSYPWGVMD